jgi:hypothetical protein
MRMVRRGAPGTAAAHNPGGSCSTRKTVTRLLVRQVLRIVSRRSGITSARSFAKGLAEGSAGTSAAAAAFYSVDPEHASTRTCGGTMSRPIYTPSTMPSSASPDPLVQYIQQALLTLAMRSRP